MRPLIYRASGVILVIAGFAAVPAIVGPQSYVVQQLDDVLALVLVAIGLNIVTGYAGQLSLGPSAIFAVAGYAAAVFANDFPRWIGLAPMSVIAVVASIAAGLIIGIPALRIGGFYLAMITLFAALIVPVIAGNLSFTGSSTGILLISNSLFFQHPSGVVLYELCVAIVMIVTFASWALLHSRVGHRFLVLRTSEELASSLGISPYRTKLYAFVLSSVPAGLGGALYVYTQQFISPGSVTTTLSIYLLAGCVVGGFGTVMGPLLGATLILALSQFLGGLAEYQGVIFGGLLLFFAVVLPQGFMGMRRSVAGNATLLNALPESLRPRLGLAAHSRSRAAQSRSRVAPEAVTETPPDRIRRDIAALLQCREDGSPASPSADLVLRGISRSFGGVTAVDDVSLTVSRSSIHGLVGSNGSGKTTLLNLISGYHRLEGGEILIGNERIGGGAQSAARAHIARTFQTPKLIAERSVVDNLVAASEQTNYARDASSFLRLPRARRIDRGARGDARLSLEALGLDDVADVEASELPHGLRRLVEIARALVLRPAFLLLDEPAAGLSGDEIERLELVLDAIRQAGVGVLLIEHNVPFVSRLADVVTVLHLGQCIAEGAPNVLVDDSRVAEAFLGAGADLTSRRTNTLIDVTERATENG